MTAIVQSVLDDLIHLGKPLSLLVVGVIVGLIAHLIFFKVARRFAENTETVLDDLLIEHCRKPMRIILAVFGVYLFIPIVRTEARPLTLLYEVLSVVLILSVAWLAIRLSAVVEEFILSQHRVGVSDNLRARTIQTQIHIIRKIVTVVIGVVALGTVFMTFSKVRQLGTSILASAGIVGLIVGFAAQRSLATLVAGLQIAFTQPIRLDDVVIVENEWGRIEEITLTYVVVRIWDSRRLIVPITQFLEKPFQNWTRISADLLGSVFLYVDYTVPMDALREELKRVTAESPLWDRRVCALQVTDTTESTVQVRALVSAANASDTWDLRCYVREKLVDFLQRHYPHSLPRHRTQWTHADTRAERERWLVAQGEKEEV